MLGANLFTGFYIARTIDVNGLSYPILCAFKSKKKEIQNQTTRPERP